MEDSVKGIFVDQKGGLLKKDTAIKLSNCFHFILDA